MLIFYSGLYPEFLLYIKIRNMGNATFLTYFKNNRLNTGIKNVEGIKYINFGDFREPELSLDNAMKKILNELMPLSLHDVCIGSFRVDGTYRAIIQPYLTREFASAIVFSYMLPEIVEYRKSNGKMVKLTTNWDATLI